MRNMNFFDDYSYEDDLYEEEMDDFGPAHVESERDYTTNQASRRYGYNTTAPRRQRSYERQPNEYVDMRRRASRHYPQDDMVDDVHISRRDRRRMRNINRLYGNAEYKEYGNEYTVNNNRYRDRYDAYDDRRYRANRRRDRHHDSRYYANNYHDSGYSRTPFIRRNHGQFQRSKGSRGQFQKSDMNFAIKLLGLILLVLMIIFAVKGESAYSGVTGVIVILFIGNFLTSKGKRSNKGR